ncbi:hypothetical protein MNV49_003233 [Pseudohyphozyma bogoriensis]|nr:hypothetical protein MNV49_003233 [Pseudohyphozyma bogoriensis]
MELSSKEEDVRLRELSGAGFASSFAPEQRPAVCENDPVVPGTLRALLFNLRVPWGKQEYYEASLIEFAGTVSMVFLSALIGVSLQGSQTNVVFVYVGCSNLVLLSLHILATAPISGGHLNPLISTAAFFTGMMELPRYVAYLAAQTLGAVSAGGLVKAVLGNKRSNLYHGGGCWIDDAEVAVHQAFLLEAVSSFCLLFLAFGLGLDPRAAQAFGSVLGPIIGSGGLALSQPRL